MALRLREKELFGSVHCAFWKEQPAYSDILDRIEEQLVYVVPNFVSEGYFTQEVIPRELKLKGEVTKTGSREIVYLPPLGNHSGMKRLVLDRIEEACSAMDLAQVSVLVAGHGTERNPNSIVAIQKKAEEVRQALPELAEVTCAYMDEAPFLSEWQEITSAPNVIIVPHFVAEGLHTLQDIPEMIGVGDDLSESAFPVRKQFGSRTLTYTKASGVDPAMVDFTLDLIHAHCSK